LPSLGAAQNLLINPDFDDGQQISGWACGNSWGTVTWSTQDLLDDPVSGSIEHYVAALDVNNAVAVCTQCVPVEDLLTYTMSGWAHWPDDPDVDQVGTTRLGFGYYAEPGCNSPLGSNEVVVASPPQLAMWFEIVSDSTAAPAGAASANVMFTTWQNFAGMPVRARIDHLDFSTTGIFVSDFERGDASRWSGVVN
jgi:hypothetical protein